MSQALQPRLPRPSMAEVRPTTDFMADFIRTGNLVLPKGEQGIVDQQIEADRWVKLNGVPHPVLTAWKSKYLVPRDELEDARFARLATIRVILYVDDFCIY